MFCIARLPKVSVDGPLAQWIRRRPPEPEIPGSSPGRVKCLFPSRCFWFGLRVAFRELRPDMAMSHGMQNPYVRRTVLAHECSRTHNRHSTTNASDDNRRTHERAKQPLHNDITKGLKPIIKRRTEVQNARRTKLRCGKHVYLRRCAPDLATQ